MTKRWSLIIFLENMRRIKLKTSVKLLMIILVQALLLPNSLPAMDNLEDLYNRSSASTLSPKVTFSGNAFKQNFELLSNSLVNNDIELPQFDNELYQDAFSGLYFDRFSEFDAALLKIVAILHSGQTPDNVDETLLEQAQIILEESTILFESIFPNQGLPTYNPQTLYDNENINPDNVHLIFESAKLFSSLGTYTVMFGGTPP